MVPDLDCPVQSQSQPGVQPDVESVASEVAADRISTRVLRRSEAGSKDPTIVARSPVNEGISYPYAEVVLLNTTLDNIAVEGWGDADKGGNVHFWEYNSHHPDGSPVDLSQRVSWSRQLDAVADAKRIADYSRPEFVLAGWKPQAEGLH